jgi:hypothetical protein
MQAQAINYVGRHTWPLQLRSQKLWGVYASNQRSPRQYGAAEDGAAIGKDDDC